MNRLESLVPEEMYRWLAEASRPALTPRKRLWRLDFR